MSLWELNEEEFKAWQDHPVTKALFGYANAQRFVLMNQWATGHFTAQDQFGTAILNAKAIGKAETWGELLSLDFEQLKEGMGDEK